MSAQGMGVEVTLGDTGKAVCDGCQQRQGRPPAAPQELPISLYVQVHPTSAGPAGTQAPEGMGVGTVLSRGSAWGQSLKEGRDLGHANTLPTRSLFWRGILSRSNPCHSVILSIVNVS